MKNIIYLVDPNCCNRCPLPLAYSEFEDSEMKVKGSLYLPLGQPFQNFVSCFVR